MIRVTTHLALSFTNFFSSISIIFMIFNVLFILLERVEYLFDIYYWGFQKSLVWCIVMRSISIYFKEFHVENAKWAFFNN